MNIFTKFHKDWTTIVNFLSIAKFLAGPDNYASPSTKKLADYFFPYKFLFFFSVGYQAFVFECCKMWFSESLAHLTPQPAASKVIEDENADSATFSDEDCCEYECNSETTTEITETDADNEEEITSGES